MTFKYIKSIIYEILHFCFFTKGSRDYFRLRNELKDFDKAFKKSIYELSKITNDLHDFVHSYKAKSLRSIRIANKEVPTNEIILICAVKDDLLKIQKQVEYHKQIGIKHFAYIDNMSTDGTYEWLNEQTEISLFRAEETFTDNRKLAWRRQVMDTFGYERWYLVLDSDEFFTYPGIEKIPIEYYIEHLENMRIRSILTPVIDMYSETHQLSIDDSKCFMGECCFFDADTYLLYKRHDEVAVCGGPRTRLFRIRTKISTYRLVKACSATIMANHEVYPASLRPNNEQRGAKAFLLHYKFLPSDIMRYKEILEKSKFDYYGEKASVAKKIFSSYVQAENMTFMYEDSQKLNASADLLKINIGDKHFFEELLTAYWLST